MSHHLVGFLTLPYDLLRADSAGLLESCSAVEYHIQTTRIVLLNASTSHLSIHTRCAASGIRMRRRRVEPPWCGVLLTHKKRPSPKTEPATRTFVRYPASHLADLQFIRGL